MIASKKSPVLLHVPKTGGTTLRFTLGLPRWFKVHRKIGNPEMVKWIRKMEDPHVFTFARDPIERAVSAFYYFVVSRDDSVKPPPGFSSVKQKAWIFSTVARIADMDVNDFFRGMLRDDALQYRRLSKVIVHFIPLSFWMDKAEAMGYPIHYYDFAKFGSEYARLLDDIGAVGAAPLQHRMDNTKQKDKWWVDLDPDVEDALRKFYADDYALLDKHGIPHT